MQDEYTKVGGIVLAAGQSLRYGADKRRALLDDGTPVLECSIANALGSGIPLIVALRTSDDDLKDHLDSYFAGRNVRFISATDSASGMGASLANAAAELGDWRACLIFLGDMPFISSETIHEIIANHGTTTHGIIIPTFNNREGHPVLFDRRYFAELQELRGDRGAKSVITQHAEDALYLVVNDAGVLRDIDMPADITGEGPR